MLTFPCPGFPRTDSVYGRVSPLQAVGGLFKGTLLGCISPFMWSVHLMHSAWILRHYQDLDSKFKQCRRRKPRDRKRSMRTFGHFHWSLPHVEPIVRSD